VPLSLSFQPSGLACTPSGALIVTCHSSRRVCAVDPATGHCELITELPPSSAGALPPPASDIAFRYSVEVVASECCAFVSDQFNHCIYRITLPPALFVASK
jgi:hypothetical protein